MGGGFKASSLLGRDFLLLCKHCRQIFDNFKLLKSHLRKIHHIQTSSTSSSSSISPPVPLPKVLTRATPTTTQNIEEEEDDDSNSETGIALNFLPPKLKFLQKTVPVSASHIISNDDKDFPETGRNGKGEFNAIYSDIIPDSDLTEIINTETDNDESRSEPIEISRTTVFAESTENNSNSIIISRPSNSAKNSEPEVQMPATFASGPVSSSGSTSSGDENKNDEAIGLGSRKRKQKISPDYLYYSNSLEPEKNTLELSCKIPLTNLSFKPGRGRLRKSKRNKKSDTSEFPTSSESAAATTTKTQVENVNEISTEEITTSSDESLRTPVISKRSYIGISPKKSRIETPLKSDLNYNFNIPGLSIRLTRLPKDVSVTPPSTKTSPSVEKEVVEIPDIYSNSNEQSQDDKNVQELQQSKSESESDDSDNGEIRPPPIVPITSVPAPKKGYRLCPHCPRMYPLRQMKAHLEIHAGLREFICPYCVPVIGFSDPVLLLSHTAKYHTKIKAFECEKCSKNYISHEALRAHQRFSLDCKSKAASEINT